MRRAKGSPKKKKRQRHPSRPRASLPLIVSPIRVGSQDVAHRRRLAHFCRCPLHFPRPRRSASATRCHSLPFPFRSCHEERTTADQSTAARRSHKPGLPCCVLLSLAPPACFLAAQARGFPSTARRSCTLLCCRCIAVSSPRACAFFPAWLCICPSHESEPSPVASRHRLILQPQDGSGRRTHPPSLRPGETHAIPTRSRPRISKRLAILSSRRMIESGLDVINAPRTPDLRA